MKRFGIYLGIKEIGDDKVTLKIFRHKNTLKKNGYKFLCSYNRYNIIMKTKSSLYDTLSARFKFLLSYHSEIFLYSKFYVGRDHIVYDTKIDKIISQQNIFYVVNVEAIVSDL